MNAITPVLLVILDGFGHRTEGDDNAILHANMPNWKRLCQENPYTTIQASENFVGLPKEQFGNSEVGHLNMGAGRVIRMDISKMDCGIEDGSFFANSTFETAVETAKQNDKALHIMGLLSDGGVHAHENHIYAMLKMGVDVGIKKLYVHAFLDGRDTPPRSAEISIKRLEDKIAEFGGGKIASIIGRYFAMDRDKRWERVLPAYELVINGKAEFTAASAQEGLAMAYARDENDEFVKATTIVGAGESPVTIEDGDAVVFMNYRADRARQITQAFAWDNFTGFERSRRPKLGYFCTATCYGEEYTNPVAYGPEKVVLCLGETIANAGLKQLRIAETEKYPHVTYFFNGGEETPFAGEDRVLVPSPKVATYDLQPEMSSQTVTQRVEEAIASGQYSAIMVNYANGDMVGHTGVYDAAVKAVEALDNCVDRIVKAMLAAGGEVIITADHGNCEQMWDAKSGQPHTQHTMSQVPFLYVGRKATLTAPGLGSLQDVAPTMLALMGVPQPEVMTGHSLVQLA